MNYLQKESIQNVKSDFFLILSTPNNKATDDTQPTIF